MSYKKDVLATYSFSQPTLLGDMRTQPVQRNDLRAMHNGNLYYMSQFNGLVTDLRIIDTNPRRARIVIELQDGKRLAFFADIDKYIKEGVIIEAVGICTKKESGFYDFRCRGGYKRVFPNEEMYQISKGISPEDAKITKVPWEIISSVRESDKINAV